MDIKRAKYILSAFADGVDPYTGEVLPIDGPFQNLETMRALFLALTSLEKQEAKEQKVRQRPNNAGRPWTAEEDEELIVGFDAGIGSKELAERHGRTKGAIEARLMRLGKITLRSS